MNLKALSLIGTVALFATLPARAAVITIDFEGVGNVVPVGEFYNGGGGTNFGISFSENALAVVDSDAGGSGNIGGEPSPDTVLGFLAGDAATLNLAAGFTTGFSFFYSAVNRPGSIDVYSGLNATGDLLASLALAITASDGGDPDGSFSPFFAIGVAFEGIAMSIDFGGTDNQIVFDNITFGSTVPGGGGDDMSPVPLPASFGFLLAGIGGLAALRRKKSA